MDRAPGRRVSVERLIPAAAPDIFAVLADPAKHALIDGSDTLVSAPARAGGPPLSLGATFVTAMSRRPPSRRPSDLMRAAIVSARAGRMTNTVVEFTADELIAWRNFGRHVWRYQLRPGTEPGTTVVRETFDYGTNPAPWLLELAGFPTANTRAMESTLLRLERLFTGDTPPAAPVENQRWRRYWDRKSANYDKEMGFWDRKLFGDSRRWACGQATGDVLEVAVGTGLNLPHYPETVALTGIDLSERMLDLARSRADALGREVVLRQGNAHALPFADASFDTVVCTFGLCAIPDPDVAIDQMVRVLRPGGRVILVDHVASSSRLGRGLQWLLERVTVPLAGEHFLRRPLPTVRARGLAIEQRDRFARGVVERLVARKPV